MRVLLVFGLLLLSCSPKSQTIQTCFPKFKQDLYVMTLHNSKQVCDDCYIKYKATGTYDKCWASCCQGCGPDQDLCCCLHGHKCTCPPDTEMNKVKSKEGGCCDKDA